MSLTCELSGEPLSATTPAVVTPSGHICQRSLLLKKLTENGSMDPFHPDRPLTEDQLIELQTTSKIVPPRPKATSFPLLLSTISEEYDALVLELFDTRKALEETRQELSAALYQNDAAVRVVARLAMERDAARAQLAEWKAGGGGTAQEEENEPPTKKRKTAEPAAEDEGELPLVNDVPASDLQAMVAIWETLHQGRKAQQKAAAAEAPSAEELASYQPSAQAWHATKCKGVVALASNESLVATAGADRHLFLFDTESASVVQSISVSGKAITAVDVSETMVAVGSANGCVKVYGKDGTEWGSSQVENTSVVDVRLHPDGQHLIAASESDRLTIYRVSKSGLTPAAVFKPDSEGKYTCGALHPDGLIYVAGSSFGEVLIWDIKGKKHATTLKNEGKDAVVAVVVSNNGYHVAAVHSSGKVCVWDLRKSKLICTLNEGDDVIADVAGLAFDKSGKYLAYGGSSKVRVTTVKEWGVTAEYDAKHPTTSLTWVGSSVVATSKKHREIMFYKTA